MEWTLVFRSSTVLFLLLVGYLFVWRRLTRAPARGLRTLRGEIHQAGEALVLATDEGLRIPVDASAASLVVLRGPRDRRPAQDLRAGDRVIVHGLEGPAGLQALRVIRCGWTEPPRWIEPAAAICALLAVVGLSRAQLTTLRVSEQRPASAPTLAQRPSPGSLRALTSRLAPLFPSSPGRPAAAPDPGPPQGFLEYIESDPRTVEGERRRLYLQPIGPLSEGQRRGLCLAADFLSRYFCLPVALAEAMPLSDVPDEGRRVHERWGIQQLQSTTLIHELLRVRLPRDAAGLLGVTALDLWPGGGWEAVRGQASLVARVGIVSLFRAGLADAGDEAFPLFLRRTLKLLVHEAGHLFSMRHCWRDACVMSGSNDAELFDARYPILCPDCLAKVVWATRCDPIPRHRALARFCREQGLPEEAAIYTYLARTLEAR